MAKNNRTINCILEKIRYTITATMTSSTGGLEINDSTYTMTNNTPLEVQVEPGTDVYFEPIDTTMDWYIINSSNETYIANGQFNASFASRTFVMPFENLSFTFYSTYEPL